MYVLYVYCALVDLDNKLYIMHGTYIKKMSRTCLLCFLTLLSPLSFEFDQVISKSTVGNDLTEHSHTKSLSGFQDRIIC